MERAITPANTKETHESVHDIIQSTFAGFFFYYLTCIRL